jgi:hypothetical protein
MGYVVWLLTGVVAENVDEMAIRLTWKVGTHGQAYQEGFTLSVG